MEILKLKPVFKQYIWGGNNIKKIYKKDTPEPPVAESWEISAHPDGLCVVSGGEYDGLTVPELCEKFGEEFYGKSMGKGEEFPLLLKILDAEDNLSVQVHPDDNYANKYENGEKGKNEAWYILKAEEDAHLIYGFKEDVTKKQFEKAIIDGTLENILNKVECHEGDVFYIPSGTVHAVCKGLMIAEIQQSSNVTYRIFDYNRVGADGRPRDLHVNKALDVSNLSNSKGKEKTSGESYNVGKSVVTKFIDNEFFHFDEIKLQDEFTGNTDDLLHMLLLIDGEASVNGTSMAKGENVLIPASVGDYKISGNGVLLRYFK